MFASISSFSFSPKDSIIINDVNLALKLVVYSIYCLASAAANKQTSAGRKQGVLICIPFRSVISA
jgi:hypothetical protein